MSSQPRAPFFSMAQRDERVYGARVLLVSALIAPLAMAPVYEAIWQLACLT